MATFKDSQDREWTIAIDAPTIMAIREDCDANFLQHDSEEDNTYNRMLEDPVLLCRVIFLLCKVERESRGVSEETFYLGVIGDAIDRATDALLKAIVNFTPRRTRVLLEMFASQEKIRQTAIEKAATRINSPELAAEISEKLAAKADAEIEKVLTQLKSATSSPVSSESTQTD